MSFKFFVLAIVLACLAVSVSAADDCNVDGCKECVSNDKEKCSECKEEFFLKNQKCTACLKNCKTCSNTTECTMCTNDKKPEKNVCASSKLITFAALTLASVLLI